MKNPNLKNLILVQGGSFEMGCDAREDDENPLHTVTLSSFYIGTYQVTQKEYQALMLENPSFFKNNDKHENFPVETVGWFDAIKYCNAKSKKEGLPIAYKEKTGDLLNAKGKITTDITKVKGYRLPTESEWEYAAKEGNINLGKPNQKYYTYSGSNNPSEVAWYSTGEWGSLGSTKEVGQKKPNKLGIYDMSGNVWEWCDWYDEKYYSKNTKLNPINTEKVVYKVLRGGSWVFFYNDLVTTKRLQYLPIKKLNDLGFRIAKSI